VPTRVYDETICVPKSAVQKAKLGNDEELSAIKRLDAQARALERDAAGLGLSQIVAGELDRSPEFGGRSVFGWEPVRSVSRTAG
jgi:hypothetical protein